MTHEIVLLGVGHTNAHILRMWRMQPLPRARLTCVSDFAIATYSGMLTGVLAGHYPPRQMEIDLVRLCAASGARLIVGEATGLDLENRRLQFANRPPIPFDVLSVGIGSEIETTALAKTGGRLLTIKPMQTLLYRLEKSLLSWKETGADRLNLVIAGGGAAGVEIACCVPNYVRKILGNVPLHLAVVHGGDTLLPDASPRTRRAMGELLKSREVDVSLNRLVRETSPGSVTLDNGTNIAADIVLMATGAKAPPLLAELGLPLDERGFLLTRETLQTTADAPVFAVGDCATRENDPVPKAGVYAVRQGPILWDNLQRQLQNLPLKKYTPQRTFLKILNLGDGRALLNYHGVCLANRWAWKLKDFIDRRFMAKHQDYSPPEMSSSKKPSTPAEMKCAGCGCKVGSSVLMRALDRLSLRESASVQIGLSHRDDAAVLSATAGKPIVVTVDYFTAPLDDPYLTGRIAALNAVNDAFAMGARPVAALAMITLPAAGDAEQEDLLFQLLAGAGSEFEPLDVALAGGHTIEGNELSIGFTIIAEPYGEWTCVKSQLAPGDVLILTKPLGTGVLLASHRQARCPAVGMESLLSTLLASNESAIIAALQLGARAATDVSGFGLANHLLEMLRASGVDAEIELECLPLLPCSAKLISEGVESTLAPANRKAAVPISTRECDHDAPAFRMLFDPQTNGGLLLALPEERARELIDALAAAGNLLPEIIGRVTEIQDQVPTLRVFGKSRRDVVAAEPKVE